LKKKKQKLKNKSTVICPVASEFLEALANKTLADYFTEMDEAVALDHIFRKMASN